MTDPNRGEIPPARRGVFYAGLALSGLGLLIFLSVFLSAALHFGDFRGFEDRTRGFAVRTVVGMVLMILGGALTRLGARGLAGSGVLLDPEKAGRDLSPWARLRGRLLDQTYS